MAAVRSRAPLPVGSMQWIHDENAQVDRHCEQEAEDFGFSARNELEWLNEHMADIFTKDQINVTEIFKTPGKLRGKTPRTARKRDPLQAREPLSDIFSTNARSHTPPVLNLQDRSPGKNAPAFRVAQDAEELPKSRTQKNINTDSGYQGLSDDDMEIDRPQSAGTVNAAENAPKSPSRLQIHPHDQSDERTTTERSFHSAREDFTKTHVLEDAPTASVPIDTAQPSSVPFAETQQAPIATDVETMGLDLEDELVVDKSRSPSQNSSPGRPLVRKNSRTFAALPPREPLTTKKSMGARASRTSQLDQSNFLGRFTGGKSLGENKQIDLPDQEHDEATLKEDLGDKPALMREESDTDAKMKRLHNKSTTQLLHEKIHQLGKSQTVRPTKSIPAAAPVSQPAYPLLSNAGTEPQELQRIAAEQDNEEDEDDWIQAPNPTSKSDARPPLFKSVSTDVMEEIRGKQTIGSTYFSTQKREQSASRAEPPLHAGKVDDLRTASDSRAASPGIYSAFDGVKTFDDVDNLGTSRSNNFGTSTTPSGSPLSKRYVDGPLSASKSKLQSIMKTAKSLFSSSAGVSAQAKMNLLSPTGEQGSESSNWEVIGSTGPSKAENQLLPVAVEEAAGRKTRSSNEKEGAKSRDGGVRRLVNQQSVETSNSSKQQAPSQVKASILTEPTNVVQSSTKSTRTSPRKVQNHEFPEVPERTTSKKINHQETSKVPRHIEQSSQTVVPPTLQDQRQPSQTQRMKDPRRPIKPAKEVAPKPKPQPLEIRVGMTSTKRIPLTNTALSTGLQESLKPQVLVAAERKKERDEKEVKRKQDLKAQFDRKRAAQPDASKRQEQVHRQEAEKQRERERSAAAEDPKKIAHKEAIEKRRKELQKDRHQQRPAANQPAPKMRPELGGSRPPSRQQNAQDNLEKSVNNHHPLNPAKAPIKRVLDADDDNAPIRSKPVNGPSYQQQEAKRRRTEDEDGEEFPLRPTHAPPVRQSGIKNNKPKPSIFSSSHGQAPLPTSQHHAGPPLLNSMTQNQAYQPYGHPQQIPRPANHPDIKQFANNRIPFADAPNPPAHQPQQQQQYPPSHKPPHQAKFAPPPSRPSPQYQNGENIHLDDIPTDSEDDESNSSPSSNAGKPKPASLPEWAQSPNLRNLLMHQEEGIDPDAVFGPVQSPHMEEMFKERHHRFRSRTSSANWAGQDRLTEEEIRKDVEARQRLRKDGGWSVGLVP